MAGLIRHLLKIGSLIIVSAGIMTMNGCGGGRMDTTYRANTPVNPHTGSRLDVRGRTQDLESSDGAIIRSERLGPAPEIQRRPIDSTVGSDQNSGSNNSNTVEFVEGINEFSLIQMDLPAPDVIRNAALNVDIPNSFFSGTAVLLRRSGNSNITFSGTFRKKVDPVTSVEQIRADFIEQVTTGQPRYAGVVLCLDPYECQSMLLQLVYRTMEAGRVVEKEKQFRFTRAVQGPRQGVTAPLPPPDASLPPPPSNNTGTDEVVTGAEIEPDVPVRVDEEAEDSVLTQPGVLNERDTGGGVYTGVIVDREAVDRLQVQEENPDNTAYTPPPPPPRAEERRDRDEQAVPTTLDGRMNHYTIFPGFPREGRGAGGRIVDCHQSARRFTFVSVRDIETDRTEMRDDALCRVWGNLARNVSTPDYGLLKIQDDPDGCWTMEATQSIVRDGVRIGSGDDSYAAGMTINLLGRVCRAVRLDEMRRNRVAMPAVKFKMQVNAASKQGGGALPYINSRGELKYHGYHRNGLDLDIDYPWDLISTREASADELTNMLWDSLKEWNRSGVLHSVLIGPSSRQRLCDWAVQNVRRSDSANTDVISKLVSMRNHSTHYHVGLNCPPRGSEGHSAACLSMPAVNAQPECTHSYRGLPMLDICNPETLVDRRNRAREDDEQKRERLALRTKILAKGWCPAQPARR